MGNQVSHLVTNSRSMQEVGDVRELGYSVNSRRPLN